MASNVTRLFQALNATPQNDSDDNAFDHPNGGFSVYEMHHTIAICVVNFVLCFYSAVSKLSRITRNLEDVFFTLAGKQLADKV